MSGVCIKKGNCAQSPELETTKMKSPMMENWMNRKIFVCAMLVATAAVVGAQQASPSDPYQGTSNPPADDQIVTSETPQAKPQAGMPAEATATTTPEQAPAQPQAAGTCAAASGTDDGIVDVANPVAQTPARTQPVLTERDYAADPDGDIVHPHPLRRGELAAGTMIRVRLLDHLSTVTTEKGEEFHTTVATDVMGGDEVLIPAGSEMDGRVVEVSSGHAGGTGTMRLQPETVILSNGERYRLRAELSGTPGSKTRIIGEGTIRPDSRLKKDGIEYGGTVGTGAVAGAILGGPAGAAAGSLIGVGVITAHLLISHPQATLDSGANLLFTLTAPLYLVPAGASGN